MQIVWLPVGYSEAADRLVALVERGVIAIQSHWLSREACQTFIDRLPQTSRKLYAPTAAIVRVAGDVGRAAPFPPASMLCGSGKPFTNAEGAPRVRHDAQTGVRSFNCGALSLGSTLAGDAGHSGAVALVTPSVPMTGRRDGACISGKPFSGRAA